MAKYALLCDRLARELTAVQMLEASRATDGELALVHSPDDIASLEIGALSPAAMREIGFPWSLAIAGCGCMQNEQTAQVQLHTYRVALDYLRRWQRLRV